MPKPFRGVSHLLRQGQRQQARGVAGVLQRLVLATLEVQAGQAQRHVQPHRAQQLPAAGEGVLEVDVRQLLEPAVQALGVPLLLQLATIVVTPAGPAGEARALVAQPGFEGRPELGEGAGAVDARLLDVGVAHLPARKPF